jgi:hypothetical protein
VRDRIPTLVFHASGAPRWERTLIDTATGRPGLAGLRQGLISGLPATWADHRWVRSLLSEGYRTLSYVLDWRDAFRVAPDLDVRLCNINDAIDYRRALGRVGDYPLVVVLHSAAGDDVRLIRRGIPCFQARRGALVVFFGNEYALMAEKLAFARATGADYVATQLPRAAAEWLYAGIAGSRLLLAPAGLNPAVYRTHGGPRPIDVGFRGEDYDAAIGDVERGDIVRRVRELAPRLGLVTDTAFVRLGRERWRDFLRGCHGVVGAESGTYYLERDDRTRRAVLRYLAERGAVPFREVHDRFFRDYHAPVSGKAVSSRHFEAIGTGTCQLLLEGAYNGILRADEHYIGVRRDLSNLEDAVARFKDLAYRRALVARAREHVLAGHTYAHRVRAVVDAVVATGVR